MRKTYNFAKVLPKHHVVQNALHFAALVLPFARTKPRQLRELILLPLSSFDDLTQVHLGYLDKSTRFVVCLKRFHCKTEARCVSVWLTDLSSIPEKGNKLTHVHQDQAVLRDVNFVKNQSERSILAVVTRFSAFLAGKVFAEVLQQRRSPTLHLILAKLSHPPQMLKVDIPMLHVLSVFCDQLAASRLIQSGKNQKCQQPEHGYSSSSAELTRSGNE